MKEQIVALATLVSTVVMPATESAIPLLSPLPEYLLFSRQEILAEQSLDLMIREEDSRANQGFSDNISLALHYLKSDVELPVDWEEVREPFAVSFTLQSGEIFAFHDNVLDEYANPTMTVNSEFMTYEGYKSVWGLGGNGVCHLASLINWVASDAGLEVVAKASHSFALIPGVPKEYGTSIRSQSQNQNLYIINNLDYPVSFEFRIDSQTVSLSLAK